MFLRGHLSVLSPAALSQRPPQLSPTPAVGTHPGRRQRRDGAAECRGADHTRWSKVGLGAAICHRVPGTQEASQVPL